MRARDRLSRALFQEHLAGRRPFSRSSRDDGGRLEGPRSREGPADASSRPATIPVLRRYPIMPAAHFTMGGIPIDEYGRTALEGLFAAGEVTCGLHGANRMGGNAALRDPCFRGKGGHGSSDGAGSVSRRGVEGPLRGTETVSPSGDSPLSVLRRIKEALWKYCGPVRTGEGLALGIDMVGRLEERTLAAQKPGGDSLRASVRNALFVARKDPGGGPGKERGPGRPLPGGLTGSLHPASLKGTDQPKLRNPENGRILVESERDRPC